MTVFGQIRGIARIVIFRFGETSREILAHRPGLAYYAKSAESIFPNSRAVS
jgi:hypothetical protein